MIALALTNLAVSICCLAIGTAASGGASIWAAAVSSIARFPSNQATILRVSFIGFALVEATGFLALLVGLSLYD